MYHIIDHFRVGPASDDYRLSISGFMGNTTDVLLAPGGNNLNSMKFTIRDRDNDGWGRNCAAAHAGNNAGGWWYDACSFIHPNYQYNNKYLIHLNGQDHSLPFIEIKIKPVNCNL